MKKYKDVLKTAVELVIETGYEILPGGTELVGRAVHLGSEARCHLFWAPLSPEEIIHLESQIGRLHSDLKSFLCETNGLSLFAGQLCIYGKRWRSDQMGMGQWLPFDIVVHNADERPLGLSKEKMLIGSTGQESNSLIIDAETGIVDCIDRKTGARLHQWGSLYEMLESEAGRLVDLYIKAKGLFPPEPAWKKDLPRIEHRTKIVEEVLNRHDIMEFGKHGEDFDYSHEALRIGTILEKRLITDLKDQIIQIFKEDFDEEMDEKSDKWIMIVNDLKSLNFDETG